MEILAFPRECWLFNSPLTQAAGARQTGLRLPGPGCLDTCSSVASQTRDSEDVCRVSSRWTAQCVNMFSIFSKSSKTVVADSDRAASCYNEPVTRGTCSEAVMSHVPRDVRTSVSVTKEYKRERKKSRSRQFRGLFSSDIEDEVTSVVSDNPQLYHRSCSMVSADTDLSRERGASFFSW